MVSHNDYGKEHNLRQFNLLKAKHCTKAPSNIQHANVNARVLLEQKLNELKLTNVLLMRKKKGKFVSKVPLKIDVMV